jgi:hypothetical protein
MKSTHKLFFLLNKQYFILDFPLGASKLQTVFACAGQESGGHSEIILESTLLQKFLD